MDDSIRSLLTIFPRWVHISAMTVLVGGCVYVRHALLKLNSVELAGLATRKEVATLMAIAFRPWLVASCVGLLVSGVCQLSSKPSIPPYYWPPFVVKMLLVVLVFRTATRLSKLDLTEENRIRYMKRLTALGGSVVVVSVILRWLSLR